MEQEIYNLYDSEVVAERIRQREVWRSITVKQNTNFMSDPAVYKGISN